MFSNINHVSTAGTININTTDHYPIFLIKKKSRLARHVVEVKGRSYRDMDWDSFSNDIEKIDLNLVFDTGDPNEVWNYLYSKVLELVNKYCPIKTIRLRTQNLPYINYDLAVQIRARDKAFSKARRTGLLSDWTLAKRLRVDVRRALIEANRNYINTQIDRAIWQVVNKNFFGAKSPR